MLFYEPLSILYVDQQHKLEYHPDGIHLIFDFFGYRLLESYGHLLRLKMGMDSRRNISWKQIVGACISLGYLGHLFFVEHLQRMFPPGEIHYKSSTRNLDETSQNKDIRHLLIWPPILK